MVSKNYLFAGSAIAARLRQECPGIRRVLEVQEASDALGAAGPVALVMFAGEYLSNADGRQMRRGADAVVVQRWLVQLVIDSKAREQSASQAGFLMWDAIKALQGWQPESAVSSLYRVSPPAPVYGDGYAIYPLTFELAVLASTAN